MVLNTLRNGCCDSAPAASSAFPSRRVEAVTGGDGRLSGWRACAEHLPCVADQCWPPQRSRPRARTFLGSTRGWQTDRPV